METDGTTAADQLATLQADRERLADRAMQPWWYDAALGGLLFLLLSAIAVNSPAITAAGIVVFGAGAWWLVNVYRRRTGMWVNGLRRGPTRKAIGVWLALYAIVIVPAMYLAFDQGHRWALVVAGAILGTSIAFISRWWGRIYIAELRSGM